MDNRIIHGTRVPMYDMQNRSTTEVGVESPGCQDFCAKIPDHGDSENLE